MKKVKVDLHTHSILSRDGGITIEEYQQILDEKLLDYVAVTDHNQIEFALDARKKLGKQIIIGEEINTGEGEIIGLYLKQKIFPGLGLMETIKVIKDQNALIFVPHPFDIKRKIVSKNMLNSILNKVDIIEVYNSRNILYWLNKRAKDFAENNNLAMAVGSDAHCLDEIGRTYNLLSATPDRNNLVELLGKADFITENIKLIHLFTPTLNRLKKM